MEWDEMACAPTSSTKQSSKTKMSCHWNNTKPTERSVICFFFSKIRFWGIDPNVFLEAPWSTIVYWKKLRGGHVCVDKKFLYLSKHSKLVLIFLNIFFFRKIDSNLFLFIRVSSLFPCFSKIHFGLFTKRPTKFLIVSIRPPRPSRKSETQI